MRANDTPLQPTDGRAVSTLMKALLLAGAAVFSLSTPAAAQDADDLRVRLGIGAQLTPVFIGA